MRPTSVQVIDERLACLKLLVKRLRAERRVAVFREQYQRITSAGHRRGKPVGAGRTAGDGVKS